MDSKSASEVALAEAFVALALDELEEDRPDQRCREDLQQQPGLVAARVAVEQDAAPGEFRDRLAVTG